MTLAAAKRSDGDVGAVVALEVRDLHLHQTVRADRLGPRGGEADVGLNDPRASPKGIVGGLMEEVAEVGAGGGGEGIQAIIVDGGHRSKRGAALQRKMAEAKKDLTLV